MGRVDVRYVGALDEVQPTWHSLLDAESCFANVRAQRMTKWMKRSMWPENCKDVSYRMVRTLPLVLVTLVALVMLLSAVLLAVVCVIALSVLLVVLLLVRLLLQMRKATQDAVQRVVSMASRFDGGEDDGGGEVVDGEGGGGGWLGCEGMWGVRDGGKGKA